MKQNLGIHAIQPNEGQLGGFNGILQGGNEDVSGRDGGDEHEKSTDCLGCE